MQTIFRWLIRIAKAGKGSVTAIGKIHRKSKTGLYSIQNCILAHYFGKCWPTFKIIPPSDSTIIM